MRSQHRTNGTSVYASVLLRKPQAPNKFSQFPGSDDTNPPGRFANHYTLISTYPPMPKTSTIPFILTAAIASTLHAQESTPESLLKKPAVQAMGATELSEVVVTGTAERPAYEAPVQAQATMLPAPLKEMPVTVNTITEQFIKDT